MPSRPRSEFTQNVLTMLAGTAAAQAIPILVAPVLTRLYAPEAFGVLAMYTVLVTLGTAVATGRYELAIVLPEGDAEALALGHVAMRLALVVSGVMLLGTLVAHDTLAGLLGVPSLGPWLPLVPLSVLAFATIQVFNGWGNRRKAYGVMAGTAVVQQGVTAGANIALGVAPILPHGLVVGALVGHCASALTLVTRWFRREPALRAAAPPVAPRPVAQAYHQFPAYNLPYSLLGAFSRDFVLVALSSFGHVAVAGFLQLGRRLLYVPVTFLTGALGQVYFQEAARTLGTPGFEALSLRLFLGIARVATAAFVFAGWWAPEAVPVIFGPAWRDAGIYLTVFTPVAFCFLFTSWPERLFEVTRQQRRALVLQVVTDGAVITMVVLLLRAGVAPLWVVGAFSAAYCVYHTAYLVILFRIAQFRLAGLVRIGLVISALGVASAGALYGLRLLLPDPRFEFGVGLALIGGFTLSQAFQLRRARAALGGAA
jgi:O-antigen/teichoic acid export membrane protein